MSTQVKHLSSQELEAGLDHILEAPADDGRLELIVRRPTIGDREILETGELNREEGLAGDSWSQRGSSRMADGSPHPDMQLNIMNSRVIDLVAQSRSRWHLAGDQLFVDLDLSSENLPAGTRLAIGEAVIEVTDQPHTGCKKFTSRYGLDAMRFVNSPTRKGMNLRGICARVVEPGTIRAGDTVRKIEG